MARDQAQQIAVYVAKLPELLLDPKNVIFFPELNDARYVVRDYNAQTFAYICARI